METIYFFLIIVTASLNAALQVLLKFAAPSVLEIVGSSATVVQKIFRLITSPYLISIAVVMLGGVMLWFKVVARVDLSRAYPLNIALTAIFTTVAALWLFRENLTVVNVSGIALIVLGMFFVLK